MTMTLDDKNTLATTSLSLEHSFWDASYHLMKKTHQTALPRGPQGKEVRPPAKSHVSKPS